MPPPRLARSLRLCHSPWSSLQIRWASDGPRDKSSPPQDGNPQKASANTKSFWWTSLFGKIPRPIQNASPSPSPTSANEASPQPNSGSALLKQPQPTRIQNAPKTPSPAGIEEGTSQPTRPPALRIVKFATFKGTATGARTEMQHLKHEVLQLRKELAVKLPPSPSTNQLAPSLSPKLRHDNEARRRGREQIVRTVIANNIASGQNKPSLKPEYHHKAQNPAGEIVPSAFQSSEQIEEAAVGRKERQSRAESTPRQEGASPSTQSSNSAETSSKPKQHRIETPTGQVRTSGRQKRLCVEGGKEAQMVEDKTAFQASKSQGHVLVGDFHSHSDDEKIGKETKSDTEPERPRRRKTRRDRVQMMKRVNKQLKKIGDEIAFIRSDINVIAGSSLEGSRGDSKVASKESSDMRMHPQYLPTQPRPVAQAGHVIKGETSTTYESSRASNSNIQTEDSHKAPFSVNAPRKQLSGTPESTLSTEKPHDEQSLLEELFPEASTPIQPHYLAVPQKTYPKLDLPDDEGSIVRKEYFTPRESQRERMIKRFQSRAEFTTVLRLNHCSTGLTESDFRRLIPKGKHIQSWVRDGEFHKIIPGRDPLTLERLPFYFLLFKSPESALAYQNNAARLHKLAGLHQSTSIFSAIPPPQGFLEDGEDISAALSSYLLAPATLKLSLNMVMQPYRPFLRELIEQEGYKPIVPNTDENGQEISKVLFWMSGYEPTVRDLFHIFSREAYDRGIRWPFYNGEAGIHHLRNVVHVKKSPSQLPPLASINNAVGVVDAPASDNVMMDAMIRGAEERSHNQMATGRLYNRWVIEFTDQDAAKRFARIWDRRVLPHPKYTSWKDVEEVRMCGTEFLW
ncbi:uncharacterized protein BDR25DRAFT_302097 [Lindgomyces ingoldianus]|uniref:Uncharacterized protein n=1 Tax=Lindgomyces ingoldianus TaxID=673940 RepID=A0ACB6R1Q8_9PLEO|nr:uncharacterized protein BDR25DRAFT_302097 [Lindgomyces ingoldianus]KAF2473081.1 hypothetical protein BDR25DRAFT_302097 [Lindgomyces ingoldianus]